MRSLTAQPQKANTSGLLGVSFKERGRPFAQIMVAGRNLQFGSSTPPSLPTQHMSLQKQIHRGGCYFAEEGESARRESLARGCADA